MSCGKSRCSRKAPAVIVMGPNRRAQDRERAAASAAAEAKRAEAEKVGRRHFSYASPLGRRTATMGRALWKAP